LKKNDIILFLSVVGLAFILLLSGWLKSENGDTVIITHGTEEYGEYPLYRDTVININGTNTVRIENGAAYMESATCPDHLCIRQGKVTDSSKKIICLPNRVTVEVTKQAQIDKVVR